MLLLTFATLLSFVASVSAVALEKRGFAFNAPHYSLYLNDAFTFNNWPGPDKIKPYNRALMAFWQTNGAQATPASWQGFTDEQRQSILTAYHDAGIALIVSAFGDDDKVISTKKDPVATAQELGAWVKKYGVDGVDIDLEDFTPLQSDQATSLDWLTKFHTELATQLPGYAVSSTPTAWMYGSAFGSANSVYCKLHSAVGDKISWYNMQLYNGHPNTWDTCENTMWKSTDPGFLSIKEISDMCGIPQSQIVVGKLWSTADLATADVAAEVPAPADLGACIAQAKATSGYPGTGIMIWAAHTDNWDGAINYLAGALAGIDTAVVSSAAPSASANASSPVASGSAAPNASAAVASGFAAPNASVVSASSSAAGSSSNVPQSSGSASASNAALGAASVSKSANAPGTTAVGQPSGASFSAKLAPAAALAAAAITLLV